MYFANVFGFSFGKYSATSENLRKSLKMFENLSETYSLKFHGNLEKRSKFTEILERPQNNPHESSAIVSFFFRSNARVQKGIHIPSREAKKVFLIAAWQLMHFGLFI